MRFFKPLDRSNLLALADYLNNAGTYRAIYCNVEMGQAERENMDRAMRSILSELAPQARITLTDRFVEKTPESSLFFTPHCTALPPLPMTSLPTADNPSPTRL